MDLNYFLPGQLWRYDTRDVEQDSTITILKVDDLEEETIIHIRIDRVRLNGGLGYLSHIAFSADALMNSLTFFVNHLEALPDFEEDYKQWKKEFDDGTINYWTVPVKEVLTGVTERMNK
jgi:hypothetical protein